MRCLRRELQAKCLLRVKIDDSGDYLDILGILRRLKDVVKPRRRPQYLRRHARELETLLEGMYDRLEAHAIAKRPGLAKVLYSEVSGQADIPSLKRIDRACREYEVSEEKKRSSGGGGSGGSSARDGSSYRSSNRSYSGRYYAEGSQGRRNSYDRRCRGYSTETYTTQRRGDWRYDADGWRMQDAEKLKQYLYKVIQYVVDAL